MKILENMLQQRNEILRKVWEEDQIRAMQLISTSKGSKVKAWSSTTIKKSLQMRLMLGANG